jgi:hypothetical protein
LRCGVIIAKDDLPRDRIALINLITPWGEILYASPPGPRAKSAIAGRFSNLDLQVVIGIGNSGLLIERGIFEGQDLRGLTSTGPQEFCLGLGAPAEDVHRQSIGGRYIIKSHSPQGKLYGVILGGVLDP